MPNGTNSRSCLSSNRPRLGTMRVMGDLSTAVGLLGPSALTLKMLGPTADYVGEGVKSWAEARVLNVRGIFAKAETKIESPALVADGAVAPRVLRGILDDGSFIEDELTQDYLGGVLASSHSEGGRDDRAATYIDVLARLSNYQIRAHYLLYRAAQRIAADLPGIDLSSVAGRDALGPLFARFPGVWLALALSDAEMDNVAALLAHSMVGLHREGLIAVQWRYSTDPEELREMSDCDRRFPSGGLEFGLSMFGIELFCAAHGFKDEPARAFSGPGPSLLPTHVDRRTGA